MIETQEIIGTLPNHARVWVYQCNRELSAQESEWVAKLAAEFIGQWNTHGKKLVADAALLHQRFLVLAVDEHEQSASGCSIDSSVGLIRQMNSQLNVDFLNRDLTCLQNAEVVRYPLASIKEHVSAGDIGPTTPVFNNLVPTLGDLRTNWLIEAKDSWLKKYFN